MPTHDHKEPISIGADPTSQTTVFPAEGIVGSKVGGRYLIERELGRGGMGVVYLARDKPEMHSRPVVVKVLLEEGLKTDWVLKKFRQEVESLTRLDDPGIVGIIDAGTLAGGTPYLVMQYVEGATLRTLIKPEGMDLQQIADVILQLGRSISAAHDAGILHRDLKPENIMLRQTASGDRQVKIIDFGIAKVRNSVFGAATSTGMTAGTIAYMSPEQLGAKHLTAASDIYALGIIAYEMVTGRRPFNPDSVFQLLETQRAGVRVKPIDLRPSLPESAQEVILKALAFEPNDRIQSGKDFGDQLARALTSELQTREAEGSSQVTTIPADVGRVAHDSGQRKQSSKDSHRLGGAQINHSAGVPVSNLYKEEISNAATPALLPSPRENLSPARRIAAVAFISLVLLTAVALFWFVKLRTRATDSAGAGPTVAAAPNSATQLTFSYSVRVQEYRNRKPNGKPFIMRGEINFGPDDRVQLLFSSPIEGYLYLINRGPDPGADWILYPDTGRPARIPGNQEVQVPAPSKNPDEDWIAFDKSAGTERLWLVWSVQPVPAFEAVKKWSNAKDLGEIKDANQDRQVREFLDSYERALAEVKRNQEGTKTTVSGSGEIIVHKIELQHH